jgi:hypothetical protein
LVNQEGALDELLAKAIAGDPGAFAAGLAS